MIEELESWHYGIATNDIYLGLWRRTQEQLLKEMNLPAKANLRDHQPTLGLLYQRLAEETATEKLGDAEYITWKRAREIVKHVAKMIGRQAQETSRYLGMDLATGKKLLKGGKLKQQ